MKLILSSIGIDEKVAKEIDSLFLKERRFVTIAVIVDAKKNKSAEEFSLSVVKNEKYITDLGFSDISYFSMEDYQPSEFIEKLSMFDIIYLLGGNTFILLNRMNTYHFGEVLKTLLGRDKLIIGQSAGSVVFSPSISVAGNDFAGDENIIGLKDYTALGVVPYTIFPHYQDTFNKEVQMLANKEPYAIRALRDGQALFIHDDVESCLGGQIETFTSSDKPLSKK